MHPDYSYFLFNTKNKSKKNDTTKNYLLEA